MHCLFAGQKDNIGIDQCSHWSMYSPPGCTILIRSPSSQNRKAPDRVLFCFGGLEGDRPPLRRQASVAALTCPRHVIHYRSRSIPREPSQNKKSTRSGFGGLEGDRTLEPHGCEPCALPAELQAHIFFCPLSRALCIISQIFHL